MHACRSTLEDPTAPGRGARLVSVEAGIARAVSGCAGEVVAADDLAPPTSGPDHALTVDASGGRVRVRIDQRTVLDCAAAAPGPGLVGIGVLGAAGAALRLALLTASRL